MNKLIGIIAVALALAVSVQAQNQVISYTNTFNTYTVITYQSNAVAMVATNIDMSKVVGITVWNNSSSGNETVKLQFSRLSTNIALNQLLGPTLAAGASISYSTGSKGGIPALPLSAKTTTNNSIAGQTIDVEILKVR